MAKKKITKRVSTLNIKRKIEKTVTKTIKLSLEKDSGGVCVIGTEETGQVWYLLRFKDDGKIRLYNSIPDKVGFELDNSGNILVETQNE